MTTAQFKDGSKDVTRRFGWWFLKPGDRLMAVEKAMGLKKGEKVKKLGTIEVVSTRKEDVGAITQDDCRREGFPDWKPADFISFICRSAKKKPTDSINRIEFKRISDNGM